MRAEWLNSMRLRIRALVWRRQLDRDLQDEIAFHLAMREEEHRATGMDPRAARAAAHRRFGNEMGFREGCREMWSFTGLESFWQDVRHAARSLRRQPGLVVVVTLILAMGIGANTAVFGYLSTLFLQPLPVPEPQQMVRVVRSSQSGGSTDVLSYPDYLDLRDRCRTFDALAVTRHVAAGLTTTGEVEQDRGELVSGSYFQVMGVPPVSGRALTPEDDVAPGSFGRVVISDRLARRRFGGPAEAVGRTLRLNGFPFAVVGVMPEAFRGTYPAEPADFWAPVMMYREVRGGDARRLDIFSRGWGWLSATGRLKRGVTLAQAADDLARVSREMQRDHPGDDAPDAVFVPRPARALPDEMQVSARSVLGFSLGVAGVLLLVACANIAAMLLARSALRARELAVRQSLGAGRWRLVREGLVEHVLIALPGGAAGVLLALLTSRALGRAVPAHVSDITPEVHADARVLAFAVAATVLTGLLTGLVPALRSAANPDLTASLKDGGLASGSRRVGRAHGAFVILQSSACLVLLVVAGLLLRSLHNTTTFDPGFRTDHLLLGNVDASRLGYTEERASVLYKGVRQRVLALPDVEYAAYGGTVPLGMGMDTTGVLIPGHTPPPGRRPWFSIAYNTIGPDYFATMGIALVSGREFVDRDVQPGAPRVAVINETMARRFWPTGDPVGAAFRMAGTGGESVTIVGVARDIVYAAPGEAPRPYIYFNPAGVADGAVTLHVRTRGDPAGLAAAVKAAVGAVDPNVAVVDLMTFADLRAVVLFPARAMTLVASIFGALVLGLTALGVYGLVSYSVSRRTREIGIRIALGAQPQRVWWQEIGRGLTLTATGLAIGLPVAAVAAYVLRNELFGVTPADPLTYAAGALLLIGVSIVACAWPARRATRVSPVDALREG